MTALRRSQAGARRIDLEDLLAAPAFLADPYPVFKQLRAEAPVQIAIETLVRRLPNLRLDPAVDPTPVLRPDITNRGLVSLHLAFDPA